MTQKALETLVGVFVVVVAAIFMLFLFQNKSNSSTDNYIVGANFYRAEGINIGTEVRMAGIAVGEVSNMSLNTETFQAEVQLGINKNIPIPTDSEVAIASDGLLGESFVEIIPGADVETLAEGETFTYVNDSVSLINLLASFASGTSEK